MPTCNAAFSSRRFRHQRMTLTSRTSLTNPPQPPQFHVFRSFASSTSFTSFTSSFQRFHNLFPMKSSILNKDLIRMLPRHNHSRQINSLHITF